ncbi:hypothetical protein OHA10_38225 [Kribbella sp. NBC_00662]
MHGLHRAQELHRTHGLHRAQELHRTHGLHRTYQLPGMLRVRYARGMLRT